MPSHYPINSSSLGFTSSISSTAVGSSAFAGGSSSYTRTASGTYANGNGASYSGKDYEALGKLQDVVWSDEEEEPECPLCMEELDPSDVHFKPMKRLQQAKQLKQKVNKQLETLGRLQYRDVRILVKNMIYVTGMKMMGESTEEVSQDCSYISIAVCRTSYRLFCQFLSILRSNDYFGQYGKIAKVFLRKGPSTSDPTSGSLESSSDSDELGIYITYLRREDASRAIATLDGVSAPGNPGKTLKVTYGSTKYCLSWLRGVKCDEGSACLGAHDWAAENDTFTRKDMTTLQQAIKNSGTNMDIMMQRQQRSTPKLASAGSSSKANKAAEETLDSSALPRTAHWAARPAPAPAPSPSLSNATVAASSIPPKRPKAKVLSLSSNGAKPTLTTLGSTSKLKSTAPTISSIAEDVRPSPAGGSSETGNTGTSRSPPTTFEEPVVVEVPTRKAPKPEQLPSAPTSESARSSVEPASASTRSPSPLSDVSQSIPKVDDNITAAESEETAQVPREDVDMVNLEQKNQPHNHQKAVESPVVSGPPPGLAVTLQEAYAPALPPTAPVVLLPQSSTQEQYQPSVQAQAMMDDVMSRREGLTPIFTVQSPYPDFEDLLAPFADGDFEYKLDVDMIIEVDDAPLPMTGVDDLLSLSNKMDGIRKTASYQGPFDPFVENQLYDAVQAMSGATAGGDAKTSRFSFAKGSGYEGQPKIPLASSADYPIAPSSRSPSERHAAPPSLNYQYFMGKENMTSATPPTRSALPYSLGVSSPGANIAIPRTRTPTLAPPPPPGLGMPQQQALQHPSFPVYQNLNGAQQQQQLRTRDQQGLNQQQHQLLTSLRDFHQPYAPERRTASPSLVQALRGGNVNTQYSARDMYTPSGESFPIQDPVVMAVRSGYLGGDVQQHQQRQSGHRNQLLEQFSLQFDPSSPYPQQQQLTGYANGGHQANQSQSAQQDMTPNARLLQQMHEQMNAMAANGNNGRSTPRSASRQAMSGRVYQLKS
ncbi:hypothetical protein QFC19_004032 [Naganishia cerealis]|uniref:Uncharacterized protein n=1 Tax=Naganishia cerealis TaxID=610337 RepID=A0ACC2VXL6_9TREE|nr:hypothetical protein QFC19_004032 [Naganishia cerealis]